MNFVNNHNDAASSSSSHSPPMEEELSVVINDLSILTLSFDAQPLPTLSLDLIEDILCRLPVKLLVQLRSVCKSWNVLISDPKFAKKQLSRSTVRLAHLLEFSDVARKYIRRSYPIHSVFNNITSDFTQCEYPPYDFDGDYPLYTRPNIVCCCNGILCLADCDDFINFVVLCNPSIRKFKVLPPYQTTQRFNTAIRSFGFGYDPFIDYYKVVVVLYYYDNFQFVYKTDVKIHTLGTNSWKTIQEFPFGCIPIERSGKLVSAAINWLAAKDINWRDNRSFIVSLDLKNESFQKILVPGDYGVVAVKLSLAVMRDWLCLIYGNDVWVMKEYGNEESWTKLFTIIYPPNVHTSNGLIFVVNFIEMIKFC